MNRGDRATLTNTDTRQLGAIARLRPALRASLAGVSHAARDEAAFRSEVWMTVLLTPLAAALPVSALQRLFLVLTMLFVIVVELLNSAIESTVDRISLERHPLSGQAKDLGSAAVAVAILMSTVSWLVIAGPVVVHWLR